MHKVFLMNYVNTCVLSPQTDRVNSYLLFITILIKYAVVWCAFESYAMLHGMLSQGQITKTATGESSTVFSGTLVKFNHCLYSSFVEFGKSGNLHIIYASL